MAAVVIGMMAIAWSSGVPAAPLPPDSAYVVVNDQGSLSVAGERTRFWGVIGRFPYAADIQEADTPAQRQARVAQAYREADLFVDRFELLGFNMVRKFNGHPHAANYTKGDGSTADVLDYFYHRLSQRGMRVWNAGFNDLGVARAEDVSIVDDPSTAEAWSEAVANSTARYRYRRIDNAANLRKNVVIAWDPRLEALVIERMRATANHVNQHSGLRWADDPVFAVWELSNEEWWIPRMLNGAWHNQPAFFKQGLLTRWHDFLTEKYGDEQGLRAAWLGLLPGENLDDGTILLAPLARPMDPALLNDANPLYRRGDDRPDAAVDVITRRDVNGVRAADMLEFLTEMIVAHKLRLRDALKPEGKSLTLSPMIFDTGRGEGIQMQYMHQHADAVSHNAYINGNAKYGDDELAPWDSGLDEFPRINEGVPWLEHNRPPNMPFLGYETQIQQPAKYRAEFPMRIASLAAIQDWDAICWHYFGPVKDIATANNPFDQPMDITVGGHPQGYHYTYDRTQSAIMRAAGLAWRLGHLPPAPEPTLFTFGRDSLFDPDSMQYGRAYDGRLPDFNTTTYTHGMRLLIDPTREDNAVDGPVVRLNDRALPSPAAAHPGIAFDWRRGSLVWDTPGSVGYVGFMARFGEEVVFDFPGASGSAGPIRLSDVTFDNPEGIAFPVDAEAERYVAFVMTSATQQPLDQTDSVVIALKSTSFNSGFELGSGRERRTQPGTLPVLEVAVGATLHSPAHAGWAVRWIDWHGREIGADAFDAQGVLVVPSDARVWTLEASRPVR
ncbi:MAG: hypothetical protein AAF823_06765 [Planctomycetota bacterium]